MPLRGSEGAGAALLNTSVTDLIGLIDARWFGEDQPASSPSPAAQGPPPPRRTSSSQLANGRRSGSSERLLMDASVDNSLGAVVLTLAHSPPRGAAATDQSNSRQQQQQEQQNLVAARGSGLPPSPHQLAQEAAQPSRTRSEPLPAAVSGAYASDLAPAGGQGGEGHGQEAETAAVPGQLGTWANRQRIFVQQKQAAAQASRPPALPIAEEETAAAGPSTSTAYMRVPGADTTAQERGQERLGRRQQSESVDEEDELNAAWRWRFARKWQTEQAKQFDPEYGKEGGDDEWGDALGYMEALAGGLNLQIARTISMDQYASLPLVSPTLSQSLMLDASIKESPLTSTIDESSMNATKHIVAVAKRAQQLLKQQQEIERQVEQRWESAAAGQPWVGQHLPAMTVDSWGKFPFVLVRLLDRSSRHKVLVRGRNGAEEGMLFSQLEQEVSRVAVQHRLPGPRLELLGSGVMEWSRERDRCLNVTASKLHSLTDARLQVKSDVSKLAGALAQSSLPVTYRIMVEGTLLKG